MEDNKEMEHWFSHYKWLDVHLPKFFEDCKVRGGWDWNVGIVTAHGDKFYSYRSDFEKAGLHFAHGCAIGLLTYCYPYSTEVRDTHAGWVPVLDWVLEQHKSGRFAKFLIPVDEMDKRFTFKHY